MNLLTRRGLFARVASGRPSLKNLLCLTLFCLPGIFTIYLFSRLNTRSARNEGDSAGDRQAVADQLDSHPTLRRERARAQELEKEDQICREAACIRAEVLNKLVAGDASLLEAAISYREWDLARSPRTYQLVMKQFPGRTDLEKYARRVMEEVEVTAKTAPAIFSTPQILPELRSQLERIETHHPGAGSIE